MTTTRRGPIVDSYFELRRDARLAEGLYFWLPSWFIGARLGRDVVRGKIGDPRNGVFWSARHGRRGMFFDGTNDFILYSGFDVKPLPGLTISLWANVLASSPYDMRFVTKSNGTAESAAWWQLSGYDNNFAAIESVRFRLKTNGTTTTLIPPADVVFIQLGRWHHIVATYDGQTMSTWVDGKKVASTAKTGNVDIDSTINMNIGREQTGGQRYSGLMDDIRIYTRGMSAAEIQWLYDETRTGDYGSIVALRKRRRYTVVAGIPPTVMTADAGAYTVAGQAATQAITTPAAAASYALGGAASGAVITSPALAGTYVLAGAQTLPTISVPVDIGTYAVTGSPAAATITIPASSTAYQVDGSTAAQTVTMPSAAGQYSATGSVTQQSILAVAVSGTYQLTGAEASLVIGQVLAADAGTYAISGAQSFAGIHMPISGGAYSVVGAAATQIVSMPSAAGQYMLSGTSAQQSTTVAAISGTYTVVGADANLVVGQVMTADAGSYLVSGAQAIFDVIAQSQPGTYSLTGAQISDIVSMPAGSAPYAVVGTSAFAHLVAAALSGSYLLQGSDANVISSVVVVVKRQDLTVKVRRTHPVSIVTRRTQFVSFA